MVSYTRRRKHQQNYCQNLKSLKLLYFINVALKKSRNAFLKEKIFFHTSSVRFLLFAASEITDMPIDVVVNKQTCSCYYVVLMMINNTKNSIFLINP